MTTAARLKTPRKLSRSTRGVTKSLVPVLVPGVSNPLVDPIIRKGKLQYVLSVTDRTDTKQSKLCTIYSCPLQRQYDLTKTTSDGSGVLNSNLIVHISSRKLSPIINDQALEQANEVVKADGGTVGVTEDPAALRRWVVTGPEVTCLITQ